MTRGSRRQSPPNARTYLLDKEGHGAFVQTSPPRALRAEELSRIIEDYARAAPNARAAGFDGVEVHAANGYLIDQFLRSGSNSRDDEWGGPIANRVRFLIEATRAVALRIGGERVGVRLSPVTPTNDAHDPDPQALFEHAVQGLALLGLAYVHTVEGQVGGARDYRQGDAPFDYVALRAAYSRAGGLGAWMVNNGYDATLARHVLDNGEADLVAFGRPFVANPDFTARLRHDVPLAPADPEKLYGGCDEGYIDYPRAPVRP